MNYFIVKNHTRWPANKLQEAFWAYLKALDRMIIESDELSVIKDHTNETLELMNKRFNKCTPLKIRWQADPVDGKTDFKLFVQDYHQPDLIIKEGKEYTYE